MCFRLPVRSNGNSNQLVKNAIPRSGTHQRMNSTSYLSFDYDGIMEQDDVVRSLAALAQPIRLQVFRALVVAGQSGMTPGTMAEGLSIPANTLSFHLKELTHAGLVTQERASRNISYRAAYGHMNALLGYLTENCCRGAACAVDETSASCC
jgi:ArsR family transcriptional regulator